ncbi:hypothetical protein I3843_10G133800 [Carya illinoinensis]|uniref:Uncharacterized protein n=1 Tax=Carya illinoinensis TaxID=32201 RepID=A0A922D2I7_CARIL|nr:hypothetical protein I3842_Q096900 [Carya illinoinensis]KAG7960624.1 hypothetical protein I3843_10G133800 [Carya illinoinensis]
MEDSASYVRMVHRLIEECILFNLSMEECMEALSKHANIIPVITSTVWKELEKENKEFFEAYAKSREERAATDQILAGIQRMLSHVNSDVSKTQSLD